MKKIKINKKFVIILTLIAVLVPTTAHAASLDISDALTTFLGNLAAFLQTALQLLQKLLWPVLVMIGGFIGNDLLFSHGMEERLLSIWVQIRNFVNIGFVVILVGLALINVLGIENEKFSLKSVLPSFVIGLIAVNFSYVAMKIILDVTNVLTVAVFAMPSSIEAQLGSTKLIPELDDDFVGPAGAGDYVAKMDDDQKKKMQSICRNLFGEAKDYKPPAFDPNNPSAEIFCEVNNGSWEYTQTGIDYFNKFSSRNAAMILAIQMMNINQLDEVNKMLVEGKDEKGEKTVSISVKDLTFNLLFNVILYVVYGSAYIALLAVLLARLVILWILVAVSPIFAIQIVLPNLIGSGGDLKEKFIHNTFAPIMIGIPLTLGYMMIDAYKNISPTSGAVQVLGSAAKSYQINASGISDLQALVMAVATVAIVWMGVFMYASKTIAGRFTDLIKQKVQGFGGRIVGLAKYVPLIPGKKGGKLSFAETMALANKPLLKLETAGREKVAKITGQWRNPSALRGITKLDANARAILGRHRETLHEKAQSAAFAEALQRMKKQGRTAELERFFPRAIRSQAFQTMNIGEIIKKFKAGGVSRAGIQAWLSSINATAGPTTGAPGKKTTPRGGAAGTAAPLSQVNKDLATNHGLGASNGGRALTNDELKVAVDGNKTELDAISTAVKNYDGKAASVAALKTALAVYSRKLKGKKTADGKAFAKAKQCVEDVLKKAATKHGKDFGQVSKHLPT